MKLSYFYLLLVLVLTVTLSCDRTLSKKLTYIDQDRPNQQPKLFAVNFISQKNESEFGSIFSAKGDECYFAADVEGRSEIRYTKLEDGQWSQPKKVISHKKYSYNDPFLSVDERQLFYISEMPRNANDSIKDYDIWYSNKIGNGWSEPINAGEAINTDNDEYYISFTSAATMYFASNRDKAAKRKHDFDIYRSTCIDGKFQPPVKLGDAINSKAYEADVFVSPDESYLIYCSARRSGLGKGDLYISFKDDNGNWTTSISMGETINTANHELCPFVTKDGKYFFYTSNQDIYWVSTSIIEVLKKKSFKQNGQD